MYVGKEKSKEEPNVNLQKLYSRIYDDLETKPSNLQFRNLKPKLRQFPIHFSELEPKP
jgi:hypothetical protein